MKYVRITKTLVDVGILVPASQLYDYVDTEAPYFKSLYYYGQDALDYSKKNKGSIRGYKGAVTTNEITFDIDSKDLEISRANTIKLLDYLESQGLYNDRAAKIAFSGSKGFHIHINTEHTFTPTELKKFCMYIAKQVKFNKSEVKIDSQVYNTNRIFRIPNTPHEKSGLFKVEMLSQDIRTFTMDEIRQAARSVQPTYEYEAAIPMAVVLEQIARIPKPKVVEVSSELSHSAQTGELPPCIAKLQDGDMDEGESNAGLLRLANHYRKSGYSRDEARQKLIQAAAARLVMYPRTNEITMDKINHEILRPIYTSEGYAFSCSDPFLIDKCGGLCKHKPVERPKVARTGSFRSAVVKEEVKPEPIVSQEPVTQARSVSFRQGAAVIPPEEKVRLMGFKRLRDTASSYDEFVKTAVKHRVLTGIKEIDDRVKIIPNGLTIINARPGVGKTTIAMNILENVSRSGQIGVFYCVDMDESEYYTKAASKALKISPDEAMDLFFSEDPEIQDLKQEAHAEADKAVSNILFNYEKHLSIEKIEADLKALHASGQKPYVIVVDYIQKIQGASEYHNATNILIALKRLISEYKVCIIALSQIPGGVGGDEETPVLSARAARGGSIYEENASVCINLWRPLKFLDDKDLYMGYAVSKNRMGECFSGVLGFKGAISQISDLTDEQKLEAQAEIEAYNELKSANSKKRGQFR
jgi:KaiC/GvpD/RAD55 family RecA-like ATPase